MSCTKCPHTPPVTVPEQASHTLLFFHLFASQSCLRRTGNKIAIFYTCSPIPKPSPFSRHCQQQQQKNGKDSDGKIVIRHWQRMEDEGIETGPGRGWAHGTMSVKLCLRAEPSRHKTCCSIRSPRSGMDTVKIQRTVWNAEEGKECERKEGRVQKHGARASTAAPCGPAVIKEIMFVFLLTPYD